MLRKFFNIRVLVFLTVLSALILRLYRGQELFFWQVDQDLISLTIKRILVDHRPVLIGFPIPGGIYLGPLYYYFASIIYFFSGLDPLQLYIFTALLGTFTTYLIYRVGKEISESVYVGIFASIIYSFSYLANVYARSISGLNFAPILALFVYLFLFRSIKSKKVEHLWLFVGVLLVAAQNEGSSISLIFLTILLFLFYRVRVTTLQILSVIAVFLIGHLPLLVFDLRHDFFLANSIVNFGERFVQAGQIDSDLSLDILSTFPNFLARIIAVSGNVDIASQIMPCADFAFDRLKSISVPAFCFSILAIGYLFFLRFSKKRPRIGDDIIFVHFLVMIGGLFVYNLFLPGYIHEWVLVIFFPAASIILAKFLMAFYKLGVWGRIAVLVFFVSFCVVNVKNTLNSGSRFGLGAKVGAVQAAMVDVGNKPFYLVSIGSCFAQGYIYLFDYYGKTPSYVEGLIFDQAFFKQGPKPNLGVILANPSDNEGENYQKLYRQYKSKAIFSKDTGDIEVLIVEDE